jgi:hypothetical protein
MVKQKLLDTARDTMRRKHLSYRTEQAYVYWMRQFILFQGKRHPGEMGVKRDEGRSSVSSIKRSIWRFLELSSWSRAKL